MTCDALIWAYLDGHASDAQQQELAQLIRADEAVADAVVRKVHFERLVLEHYRRLDVMEVMSSIENLSDDKDWTAFLSTFGDDPVCGALLNEVLEQETAAAARRINTPPDPDEPDPRFAPPAPATTHAPVRTIIIPRWVAYGTVAAMLALLALVIPRFVPDDDPQPQPTQIPTPPPLATVPPDATPPAAPVEPAFILLRESRDAIWGYNIRPARPGDEPRDPTLASYDLQRGFVELANGAGTRWIVQAPARFSALGPSILQLDSGAATVHVGADDLGFTVRTLAGVVVDLGTRFVVDARSPGTVQVYVAQGEVQLTSSHPSAVATPLREGHAAAMTGSRPNVEMMPARPERFAWNWSDVQQLPQASDTVCFLLSLPPSLDLSTLTDVQTIFAFRERAEIVLPRDVWCNIGQPGVYNTLPEPTLITAGTIVDSYYVAFHSGINDPQFIAQSGKLTFDRPILGVIATSDAQSQTDDALGVANVLYPTGVVDRGVEMSRGHQDVVLISEDRRTIQFHMNVSSGTDHLRILVEAAPANVTED